MEQLGIEPIQLLTQVFNFILMLIVLTKILYKPITRALDERRKKIAEGLEYAEKMQRELEKNEQKRQEIIQKAKEEARKIIEDGKKSGKKIEVDIIQKAHQEARAIIEKGKKELDLEHSEMEKQLRKQTVEIASSMALQVIQQVLTESDHKAIIDKKLKEMSQRIK